MKLRALAKENRKTRVVSLADLVTSLKVIAYSETYVRESAIDELVLGVLEQALVNHPLCKPHPFEEGLFCIHSLRKVFSEDILVELEDYAHQALTVELLNLIPNTRYLRKAYYSFPSEASILFYIHPDDLQEASYE